MIPLDKLSRGGRASSRSILTRTVYLAEKAALYSIARLALEPKSHSLDFYLFNRNLCSERTFRCPGIVVVLLLLLGEGRLTRYQNKRLQDGKMEDGRAGTFSLVSSSCFYSNTYAQAQLLMSGIYLHTRSFCNKATSDSSSRIISFY